MINLDTIIKILRKRGHKTDWPEHTRRMLKRLEEVRLGFPGIRNDHLSLIERGKLVEGDIFIYDSYLGTSRGGDEAPLMLKIVGGGQYYVEGIGLGLDLIRDSDRTKIRWRDIIGYNIPEDTLVCKVDVKPSMNGGPGYYYFYKSYRDFRL